MLALIIAALLCTLGYLAGSCLSGRIGPVAELLGGLVLVALGIKILVEHVSA